MDRENRIAEEERQNRTGRTGQAEQDRQNGTGRRGQAGQDRYLDRISQSGQNKSNQIKSNPFIASRITITI